MIECRVPDHIFETLPDGTMICFECDFRFDPNFKPDPDDIPEPLWALREMQEFPLDLKIRITKERIKEWHRHWNGKISVSFSGGKDSTVLLHIAREVFPDIPAIFVNTGLEYPEIREFVDTFENVTIIKPKKSFAQIIKQYGYPVISKDQACAISRYHNTKSPLQKYRRLNGWPKGKKGMISKKWQFLIDAPFKVSDKCCSALKTEPLTRITKKLGLYPMTAVMAAESQSRRMQYRKFGCNAFDAKIPRSWPMSFWTEKDIWEFKKTRGIEFSKIYEMGEARTGCMFCMFGVHCEKSPNRFERMAKTHPKLHTYCMKKLGIKQVLDYIGVNSGETT